MKKIILTTSILIQINSFAQQTNNDSKDCLAFDREKAEWVAIKCSEYGFLMKSNTGFGTNSKKPNQYLYPPQESKILEYSPSADEVEGLSLLQILILRFGGNPGWSPFIF